MSAELWSEDSHRSQRSSTHGPRQRLARWVGVGTGWSIGDGLDGGRRTPATGPDSAARRRRRISATSTAVQRPLHADRHPATAESPRRLESILCGSHRRRAVTQPRDAHRVRAERAGRLSVQHDADVQHRQATSCLRRRPS